MVAFFLWSGMGVCTLDGVVSPVASGWVIRIAPEVSRCTRNVGDTPLCYLCIQAKANSLEQYTMTDGVVEP